MPSIFVCVLDIKLELWCSQGKHFTDISLLAPDFYFLFCFEMESNYTLQNVASKGRKLYYLLFFSVSILIPSTTRLITSSQCSWWAGMWIQVSTEDLEGSLVYWNYEILIMNYFLSCYISNTNIHHSVMGLSSVSSLWSHFHFPVLKSASVALSKKT